MTGEPQPTEAEGDPSEAQFTPFERLKHLDDAGNEYWSARDLYVLLGYTTWRRFGGALEKAEIACANSGQDIKEHFDIYVKMIPAGNGARRKIQDYNLTRYACYLVVQNADPSKEIVALGQTYFAIQVRRQELRDLAELSDEDRKRLLHGELLDLQTMRLAERASVAGIVTTEDLANFQDFGYVGLYGGLSAEDIRKLKQLPPDQDITQYMGSEEQADNFFRAAQTRARLERDAITDKEKANHTHYQVGKRVRDLIEEVSGSLPENLPKPGESLEQLKARELELKQLKKLIPPADKKP